MRMTLLVAICILLLSSQQWGIVDAILMSPIKSMAIMSQQQQQQQWQHPHKTLAPIVASVASVASAGAEESLAKRVIRMPKEVVITTAKSFISTAQVMVPIGCMLQIRTLFKDGPKLWVKTGSKMGVEWGVISGAFAGGEAFFAVLRGKQDRWNTYFGSGLASAIMGAKDGPLGVVQGFCAGFAFIYAIDRFLPSGGEELPPTMSTPGNLAGRSMVAGSKMMPSVNRASAAAAVKRYKKF